MNVVRVPLNGRAVDAFTLVSEPAIEMVSLHRWYLANNGYVKTSRGLYMHRLLMAAEPDEYIDHLNFDRADNRYENLTCCSQAQNNRRVRKKSHSRQPYKGVRLRDGRWAARIRVDSRELYLGRYADPESAARAYDAAAKEYFGAFAVLNFPEVYDV